MFEILVVGTGYVGLVVGACLAESGHQVTCVDIDAAKIARLRVGVIPIFEPGLDELVLRNHAVGRLRFSTDVAQAASVANIVFLAVGTPPGEDGSADLRHVLDAVALVGANLQHEAVIITKSTVPVGTAAKVADVLARVARVPFHVCSNPEFLKEGEAVADFLKPDRIVVGVDSEYARGVMEQLYAPLVKDGTAILFMDIASAELTKYAANAMLATRISFMNEMAHLCDRVGADVEQVRRGIGSDPRIGSDFLRAGPGYGGSCFPKDVRALLHTGDVHDVPLRVVRAVEAANEVQRGMMFDKLRSALGGNVEGARVAVWGLAFKPDTDDMRESPSLTLIGALLSAGAEVTAHDPVAMDRAKVELGSRVTFADSKYDVLHGADALAIVTDWKKYRSPDFPRMRASLARPIIVDGRNMYAPATMTKLGFSYYSVGRPRR